VTAHFAVRYKARPVQAAVRVTFFVLVALVVVALAPFGHAGDLGESSSAREPPPDPGQMTLAPDPDDSLDDQEESDGQEDTVDPVDQGEVEDSVTTTDSFLAHVDAGKHKRPHGGCPRSMVRARDYCIDRYEAPNRRGAKPLVMQSANDAVAWCSARHKRLCTEDEWVAACEGDERRPYPYGATHVEGRCTDDQPWRQVDESSLAKWPSREAKEHARTLYQATPSGSKRKCVSEIGARDLTGNVEEWVVRTRDHEQDWPYVLAGCYWSGCYGGSKPTCRSTNDAHGPDFRFYETGFRCCRDVAQPK
jgi:formylglycine-generating enzyme required for sulfatase activity